MKSTFRYPGGKSRVADKLLKYMPVDTLEYREPFVGGGGVYFGLNCSLSIPRWINDLNSGLMEVYKAFLTRPEEFIKKCREIAAISPGEEEVATKGLGKRKVKDDGKKYNKRLGTVFNSFKYNELMDQALRYYFINRTVWGGRVNYDPAFESRMYYSNPTGWNIVHKRGFLESVAIHIAGTKITCTDYNELLVAPGKRVWIYLDPPYVVDTHLDKGSRLYEFGFTMDEHRRFVENCKATQHRIAISYDDVPVVREWFQEKDGFYIHEETWKYSGTTNKTKVQGKELVITNYKVAGYNLSSAIDFDS